MRTLKITIPGPIPRELSPNWQPRGGSGAWTKNTRELDYQYLAYVHICDARNLWERQNNQKWLPLEKANLQITVSYQGRQKRQDDANLSQSLKSATDALCTWRFRARFRAEIILDDKPECLTILKPVWVKGEPAVEFIIKESVCSVCVLNIVSGSG